MIRKPEAASLRLSIPGPASIGRPPRPAATCPASLPVLRSPALLLVIFRRPPASPAPATIAGFTGLVLSPANSGARLTSPGCACVLLLREAGRPVGAHPTVLASQRAQLAGAPRLT